MSGETKTRPCHCGKPATYGPPPLCTEHALDKLGRMIAALQADASMAQSSARWRLEAERVRLLVESAAREEAGS